MAERGWWRSAVLYQVYVRSFCDANGDGIGDLPGIRSKLPYLRDLGVDGIWLTPFYPSPGADHGYDVADYCDVDPQFGTLADFDALLADAHELGLRMIVDVVPNHTSIAHPWFRGHPDWYVRREGRDGGPPNDWRSTWSGPAWTRDEERGDWYLHLFAPAQPDLDWHNPEVQLAFEDVLRFWLDRGVDGFRIDVAQALFKDPELADVEEPESRPWWADWHTGVNRPELHGLYRRWRHLADAYPGERMFVGELVLRDQQTIASYVRPDELQLAFNFAFLHERFQAAALRGVIDATLAALGQVHATPTWVFENHDVTRLPTRLGGGDDGLRRARAAVLLLLALPGTAFLYQGQELGLEEVDLPDELRQDPIFLRTSGARKGRDGCRVPVPWAEEPGGFGFTTGTPWLPIPETWGPVAADVQAEDSASSLALTRAALELRPRLGKGPFRWLDAPPGVLAFTRGDVRCLVNLDGPDMPVGEALLASEELEGTLRPGAAAWFRERIGS
ncbi:MAG TPA: alpha-amylase family glycosyl hydrolase [Gaiellaceae bacterium]|nr:alpha-amylase family glycosyl hydrolase [Gaiellaceae bacterium]